MKFPGSGYVRGKPGVSIHDTSQVIGILNVVRFSQNMVGWERIPHNSQPIPIVARWYGLEFSQERQLLADLQNRPALAETRLWEQP